MEKVTTHPVPSYSLTMPAGEDTPAETTRFLDAVLTAIQNTVKRENAALRKFKPVASIGATSYSEKLKPPIASLRGTTYGGPLSGSIKELTKRENNK